jgi:hypothetical protein
MVPDTQMSLRKFPLARSTARFVAEISLRTALR